MTWYICWCIFGYLCRWMRGVSVSSPDDPVVVKHHSKHRVVFAPDMWQRQGQTAYTKVQRLLIPGGGEPERVGDTFHVLCPIQDDVPAWQHAVAFDQDEWDELFQASLSAHPVYNADAFQPPNAGTS